MLRSLFSTRYLGWLLCLNLLLVGGLGCSPPQSVADDPEATPPSEAAIADDAATDAEAGDAAGSDNRAEAEAEAEAEARAQWEAQQAHIANVVATKGRAELIADSPTKGNPDAGIVLFKFSDFQCPYCAVASGDMKTFMEGREDVLYVYKHFPLDRIHPEATPAAKAAWAAQQQGQFWLYHDGLFAYQDRLGEDLYLELAEDIGLDMEQFNRDRNSDAAAAAVEADLNLASELKLPGTPTFVMNDLLIPGGAPLTFFEEAAVRIKTYNDAQAEPDNGAE